MWSAETFVEISGMVIVTVTGGLGVRELACGFTVFVG